MQRMLVLISFLAFGGVAHAQAWGPYGRPAPRPYVTAIYAGDPIWYVGIGGFGTRILGQSGGPEELNSGGGLSVYAGVHVSRALSLELGWMGSLHNPAPVSTWWGPETDYLVLEGATADAKIHLGGFGGLVPYLQGGVGLYWLGSDHFGADSVGAGFQLGGGLDLWLSRSVSLGARVLYRGIAMGPPDANFNDTFINALTAEGTLAVHF